MSRNVTVRLGHDDLEQENLLKKEAEKQLFGGHQRVKLARQRSGILGLTLSVIFQHTVTLGVFALPAACCMVLSALQWQKVISNSYTEPHVFTMRLLQRF